MTNEKILKMLNIHLGQKPDKFSMNLFAFFGFGFTILLPFLLFFKSKPITFLEIFICSSVFIIDFIFLVIIKFIKNPIYEFPILFFVSLSSLLKLVFISISFYFEEVKNDPDILGLEYLLIPLIISFLAFIVTKEKYLSMQFLKTHTISEAQDFIANRKINKPSKTILILFTSISCPYTLIRLVKRSFNIPFTFMIWSLASIWIFFVVITGYNYIIALRYRAFKIYKDMQQQNN